MFPYTDPAGLNFLNKLTVEAAFRRIIDAEYDLAARQDNSAITWLEAFDSVPAAQKKIESISWLAFPIVAGAGVPAAQVDTNRFELQEEYVEWRAERSGGAVRSVVFTTEFPEYFEAFAEAGHDDLVAAIRQIDPAANPTARELYGRNTPSADPLQRSTDFRSNRQANPWNNGEKGILCLAHGSNTLGALFGLLRACGVDKSPAPIAATCANAGGGACVVGRASDPTVCSAAQGLAREEKCFTLIDPAGIRILELEGDWTLDDEDIDLNDFANNNGIWKLERGGRRGTLTIPPGLRLGGDPVTSGAQVSRRVRVVAEVVTAAENVLPDWARTGNEDLGRGGV